MIEVLNFTINKNSRHNEYRIVKENADNYEKFRIHQYLFQESVWVDESNEFWLSLDAVLASATFQNLFK